ncbi:MAG: ABC transporter permease subunit, partial [Rhodospirillaceae bacterium]|nr:ABC transporter permease subunit [Rhodospirillaceae bacterium]
MSAAVLSAAAGTAAGRRDVRRRRLRRFLRHRLAVASAVVLALLILAAAFAPAVERLLGADIRDVDLSAILQGPSLAHPLGTDELGRDLLVRLLYGGRISLLVGLVAAVFSAIIGAGIGIVAGYFGGRLDDLLMRFTDGVIALPILPLLIVLAAVDLTKLGLPASVANASDISLYRIIVITALFGWTGVARLVRGATLSLKEREFV